ncbi:hypothetical protein [Butyricicoccus intestinisimiae]|uniref:Uncharacterized protein n=1 Tax=Butyricicoccus intestinisimiae TaxID=2841509 RepID=A0ABS6EPI2_9FIRM|nr:hypothetical protein [Butyricicoccus intestinisimiae]MBU5489600.1 hypothetical protein [Butyricicoccus intestinisimiae]
MFKLLIRPYTLSSDEESKKIIQKLHAAGIRVQKYNDSTLSLSWDETQTVVNARNAGRPHKIFRDCVGNVITWDSIYQFIQSLSYKPSIDCLSSEISRHFDSISYSSARRRLRENKPDTPNSKLRAGNNEPF